MEKAKARRSGPELAISASAASATINDLSYESKFELFRNTRLIENLANWERRRSARAHEHGAPQRAQKNPRPVAGSQEKEEKKGKNFRYKEEIIIV